MKFLKQKKAIAALAAVAVVAIAAVGAYAYFTSGGSGNGQARVGTSTGFVLHGTAAGLAYPGDGPTGQTVTFTVDNTGSASQNLAAIQLVSVQACASAWTYPGGVATCAPGDSLPSCGGLNSPTSDFQMADVTVGQDYAPGSGQSVTPTGKLIMNDLAASQDTCKNAYLNLVLSST
jgi:hypothetical protein